MLSWIKSGREVEHGKSAHRYRLCFNGPPMRAGGLENLTTLCLAPVSTCVYFFARCIQRVGFLNGWKSPDWQTSNLAIKRGGSNLAVPIIL